MRLRAPPGAAVTRRCAPTRFFTKKASPGHPQMVVGGICVAGCGGEVKLHMGTPGMVFVWGKPHSSKTAFLQALANVTKVTYCSFKEEKCTRRVVHGSVQRYALEQCSPTRRELCNSGCTSAADLRASPPAAGPSVNRQLLTG